MKYSHIRRESSLDEEHLLSPVEKHSETADHHQHRCRVSSIPRWVFAMNAALFLLSLVMFVTSFRLYREAGGFHGRNYLLKMTSQPSPVLDRIDIPLITKTANGSLLETEPRNIFRQPPSPEVDAAWERIQTRDPIPITREDVIRLGKEPDNAAKFPESFGFGPDAYIGKIDVFHQIHCLNTLRKNLRSNFPYYYGRDYPGDTPTDRFHDLHVSHCVNALLENLMCAANVDVYTHFWMDAQVHAFPDFYINHKCRDFDAILAFQEQHAVPVERFAEVRAPEGYKVHVMSHEFKEVMHWYDDHPDDGILGGESA
ncbi:hypothetical protein VTK73DRAFT_5938 [Phialemonium thermophilum]|uniref:Tat pathway signal sequence n=1 Tax=Phialemonium thermophilum TaxID=223376 RepID=A0ABR3WLN6_9PEZI